MRHYPNRLPAHLTPYKFPKTKGPCVEECPRLDVAELIAPLTLTERRTREVYVPPGHPDVVLVRGTRGVLHGAWWWLLCPRCTTRREVLYRLPGSPAGAWACRICLNLGRATTRYRPGNPLRQKLGHRARIRAERRKRAQRRQAETARRLAEHQQREWARRLANPRTPDDWLALRTEAAREATLAVEEYLAAVREQAARAARAELAADAEGNRVFLELLATAAPTKTLRRKAADALARMGRDTFAGQLKRALAELDV